MLPHRDLGIPVRATGHALFFADHRAPAPGAGLEDHAWRECPHSLGWLCPRCQPLRLQGQKTEGGAGTPNHERMRGPDWPRLKWVYEHAGPGREPWPPAHRVRSCSGQSPAEQQARRCPETRWGLLQPEHTPGWELGSDQGGRVSRWGDKGPDAQQAEPCFLPGLGGSALCPDQEPGWANGTSGAGGGGGGSKVLIE